MPALRIVLADDNDAYRAGLARAIAAHGAFTLVAEADNGLAALGAIDELRPDVALLDVRMPWLTGPQVCVEVRRLLPPPRCRLVLCSAFADAGAADRAREVGADAYLSKDLPRKAMLDVLLRPLADPDGG